LVFSQRAITEEAALSKQKELLDVVPVEKTVEATITGVAPFGAFAKFSVEKDGEKHDVEGLIHISEIAWEKVEDPNQYLKSGDSIKVKVIGVDINTGKVTLSVKQLLPDPWEHVLDMFEKDSQVKGKVTRVTPYGIFVELSPGVEGLVHISKVSPGAEPKSGDEITCLVEDVKPDQRKISLSMALTEKPIGYR
jgi:small subunit ribosomal protein S1